MLSLPCPFHILLCGAGLEKLQVELKLIMQMEMFTKVSVNLSIIDSRPCVISLLFLKKIFPEPVFAGSHR